MKGWLLGTSVLSGFVLAVAAGAAQAQTAQVEEVVVTAQRRSENLQTVPMAVTALNESFIAKNNIRTLEDLSATVPGLVSTTSVNYGAAPLSIRGVGGANGGGNNFGDEPVAVYIDDVYIGRLRVSTSDLVDVGSIEVLRGPQGALYGRNATAGALLIRSAAPTDDLQAMFRASYTSLGEYRLQGMVSGPIADTLTGRIAVGHTRKTGWARNQVTGERLPNGADTTVRASLKYEPTAALTFDLIGEYSESDSSIGLLNVSDLSLLSSTAPPNTVHPFEQRSDFNDAVKHSRFASDLPIESAQDSLAVTFKGNWEMEWGALSLVSGWRKYDVTGEQDSDASPLFLFNNNGHFKDSEWANELRATSKSDQRLRWIAGLSYIHEQNEMDPFLTRNQFAVGGSGVATTFLASQEVDAYAGYVDVVFDVTDQILVHASGRYSTETKSVVSNVTSRLIRAFPPLGLSAGAVVGGPAIGSAKGRWSDFSPRVVVEYKPIERVLIYGSYTQGFKSGGFNSFAVSGPDEFEPEEITAWEIGAKTDLLDGSLRLNASAFTYDYTNLQVRLPVPGGGVNIANAAGAEIKGVELEAIWNPLDGLQLSGSLAYLDARFISGELPTVPSAYEFGGAIVQPIEDLAGNRLSRAPEWQYSFTGRYAWSLGDGGDLVAEVSYRHQSKIFFLETDQTAETYRGAAWGQADAHLDYTSAGGRFEISAFVRNLSDDRRVTQVTSLGGLPVAAINEPRKVGVQLTIRH